MRVLSPNEVYEVSGGFIDTDNLLEAAQLAGFGSLAAGYFGINKGDFFLGFLTFAAYHVLPIVAQIDHGGIGLGILMATYYIGGLSVIILYQVGSNVSKARFPLDPL